MKCKPGLNLSVGLLAFALSACAHQGQPKVPGGQQGVPIAWTYSYDQHGNVAVIEDPAGRKTTMSSTFFDGNRENPVQRVTRRTEDGKEVTYSFDPLGRRIAMRDGVGETTYAYDGFGRLSRVVRGGGETVTYTYDFEGRLTSIGVGAGSDVRYRYDYLGRLSEVATPAGPIVFEYHPAHRQVVRRFPRGVTTTWTFRPSGDLESLVHRDAKPALLASYAYAYRPDGRLASIDESASAGHTRHVTFEYDPDHRLTRAADNRSQDFRYQYDILGNRTAASAKGTQQVTTTYDWAGRVLEHAGKPAKFDAAGNLSEYSGPQGRRAFEHDAQNRLIAVQAGAGAVRYEYDGDGLVVRRKTGNGTSTFVTDPSSGIWKPLLARNEAAKQTLYVWVGERVIATVADGQARFYLEDHLGTARHTIDGATGTVTELRVDPYGNPLEALSGEELRVGIGGLFLDGSAGVYLTAARAYDPEIGQFIERDPVVNVEPARSTLAYAYCSGDPVNLVDPDGHRERSWLDNVFGDAKAFWSDPRARNPLFWFDPVGVPETYAEWRTEALGNVPKTDNPLARAALSAQADAFDFLGGLVGGKEGGQRQWNAAISLTLSATGVLKPVEHLRNALQMRLDLSKGDVVSAALSASPYVFRGIGAGARAAASGFEIDAGYAASAGALGPYLKATTAQSILSTVAQRADLGERALRFASRLDKILDLRNPASPAGGGDSTAGTVGGPGDIGGGAFGTGGPQTPQDIGGVSLAAAPDALAYLGDIEGVVLDAKNSRILLISSAKGTVDLPPLQLDDIVTIFRAVYGANSGGPYVSIDPDRADPRRQRTVRIEPLIQDTHVGWVLFEADRVMKGYAAGKDNVTGNLLRSRVPGYRSVPEIVMASGITGESRNRYWITPSEIRVQQSSSGTATLVTAPMKVATEKLLTADGQLTSLKGVTSPHSEAFARWFTENYSRIEAEYAAPPPSGGRESRPERVFAQVRRMSAISAVAYGLLAQGKPLPRWMRDWNVAKVPVPRTTPTVQTSKEKREAVAGGTRVSGVEYLGGACTLAKSTNNPNCPVPVIEPNSPRANALQAAAVAALRDPAPFARVEFTTADDGVKHRAVALPGWETKDLGANVLAWTDLRPLSGAGNGLALERYSNSFFSAGGEAGARWKLDVPTLVAERRAVLGPDGRIQGYCQQERVEWPMGRRRIGLSPRQRGGVPKNLEGATLSFLPAEGDCTTGSVKVVDRGERVYSDDDGLLLALQTKEHLRVYRWTRSGNSRLLSSIEEWLGDKVVAKIELAYSGNFVKSAAGCWGGDVKANRCAERRSVSYGYGTDRRLARVAGDGSDVRYAYRGGQIARVDIGRGAKGTRREYEYDSRGHLVRERLAGGRWVTHDVGHGGRGMSAASRVGSGSGALVATADYDSELRLTSRALPDGAKETWEYGSAGVTRLTTLSDGSVFKSVWDAEGRLQGVGGPSGPLAQFDWEDDEFPSGIQTASSEYLLRTNRNRGLSGYVLTPRGSTEESLQVELGELTRTFHLRQGGTEYRAKVVVSSDGASRQVEWGDVKTKPETVKVSQSPTGTLETVTSWGDRQTITARDGLVEAILATRAGQAAQVSFDRGRPVKLVDFDRGVTSFEYDGQGALSRVASPGGLVTMFSHDRKTRTKTVSVQGKYALTAKYDAAGRLVSLVQAPAPQ